MMIKRLPSILLVSYLAFTLGGCGLFQNSEESTEQTPVSESPKPSPEDPEQVFEEPETTATTPTFSATEGLIPSTPPGQRTQTIKPGRENPFAVIPIKPVVRQKTASNGVAEPEKLCQLQEVKRAPQTTVAQTPNQGNPAAATPVSDVGLPPLLPPVLPIPNEARGVVVSGVMQLNGTPVAIVKAPNENVARQVRVGASLSNGQVTVKAINVGGQKPYIVLEQYGLEIPRAIGEPAEEPVAPPEPPTPQTDGTPPEPGETPQETAAVEPSLPAPGPNGFGTVKYITLLTLNIGEVVLGEDSEQTSTRAYGTICNQGFSTLTVRRLSLQVEDKQSGVVLDSFEIVLGDGDIGVTIQSGQKALFDGTIPKLRGRKQGNVNIKLTGWS